MNRTPRTLHPAQRVSSVAAALALLCVFGCDGRRAQTTDAGAGEDGDPLLADAGEAAADAAVPGTDASPDAPPLDPTRDWSLLARHLDDAMARGAMRGYAIQVFDHDDTLLFEQEDGVCATAGFCPSGSPAFTVDLVTAVASSTKWVSSTTVLATLDAAVERGEFASLDEALDTRIDRFLTCDGGVPAPYDAVTLRQLMSFTSGVAADHDCVGRATYAGSSQTLETCACTILRDSASSLVARPEAGRITDGHAPGTTYKYGESHLTIAGAVAERIDMRPWSAIFEARVRGPAGLEMTYRATHGNPSLAGSVQASVAEYARFVRAVFHDGRDGTGLVLSRAAVEEQRSAQVGADVVLRNAPQPGMAYGLNTWRMCTEWPTLPDLAAGRAPAARPDCTAPFQNRHGGKGRQQPFIDLSSDAYVVFAMREDSAGGGDDYSGTLGVTEGVRSLTALILAGRVGAP